jgi:hypothetical protein
VNVILVTNSRSYTATAIETAGADDSRVDWMVASGTGVVRPTVARERVPGREWTIPARRPSP